MTTTLQKESPTSEEWKEEFDVHVAYLRRKTGYDGSLNIPTDFGFKTEINWNGVKAFIESLLLSEREALKQQAIACVPERMTERNMAQLSEKYEATTVSEVELWNDCREQTLSVLNKL